MRRLPVDEAVKARIREVNDALELLKGLVTKRFKELTIYEKLSIQYLIIPAR